MSAGNNYGMSVEVDNHTGDVLAVYLRVRRGRTATTKEVQEGTVFADYNARGQLLGVELLGPCSVEILDQIAADQPEAQRFLRRSVPREMAIGT